MESEGLVKKPARAPSLLVVDLSGTLLDRYWGRGCEWIRLRGWDTLDTDRKRLTIILVSHVVHEQTGVSHSETGGDGMSRKTENPAPTGSSERGLGKPDETVCRVLFRQRYQLE